MKIEPVIKYQNGLNNFQEADETEKNTQNGDFHIQNGGHQIQNGDHKIQNEATEEINDDAPLNILAGADWESLNYSVLNVSLILFFYKLELAVAILKFVLFKD